MSDDSARRAMFALSFELLENLLVLPDDCKIRGITTDSTALDVALVIVEGPDFPVVNRGDRIPEVTGPRYELVDGKPRFVGWRH